MAGVRVRWIEFDADGCSVVLVRVVVSSGMGREAAAPEQGGGFSTREMPAPLGLHTPLSWGCAHARVTVFGCLGALADVFILKNA